MLSNVISIIRRYPALTLAILLIITFIPFLGETIFNTKGEPREAIVAVSMLQSGDWILPISNGDIPYKPPMLAWCIAILSFLNGFEVNEFISRLPSALSMIVMGLIIFHYTRRSTDKTSLAFFTVLVLVTMFEVHRAATNCRVDMLLTAFMVSAIYRLNLSAQATKRFIDIPSILLLSGAVLTKGPVGMIIPCAITWIIMLTRKQKFLRSTLSMAITGLLSLIIPAIWYFAAYKQGGTEFLDLVIEENFGRMTGRMTYESHVNPWWYNIITIVAGMLPYTLILLSAPFIINYKSPKTSKIKSWWQNLNRFDRLMFVSALFIFVFYCIPASKRSVYLLPMYPMLAYGIVKFIHIIYNKPTVIKIYAAFIATLAILLPIALCVIKMVGPFGHKSILLTTQGLAAINFSFLSILALLLSLVTAILTWKAIVSNQTIRAIKFAVVTTMTIYWTFSSIYQPAALNLKSDLPVAREIERLYPDNNYPMAWLEPGMMRFYTINFYLHDRLLYTDCPKGKSGQLLIPSNHLDILKEKFGQEYNFEIVKEFDHRSCDFKSNIYIIDYKIK